MDTKKKDHIKWICLVALLWLQITIQSVTKTTSCDATEFFDISSLCCVTCSSLDASFVPNEDDVDVYGNSLSCRCDGGYKYSDQTCTTSV